MRKVDLAVHRAGLKLSIKKHQRAALGILDSEIEQVQFALQSFNPVTGLLVWKVGIGVTGTLIRHFTNSLCELSVDREMRVTIPAVGSIQFVGASDDTEMTEFDVDLDDHGCFTTQLPLDWFIPQKNSLGDW